jgi:DHA2 family multidrug resistance protein
MPHVETRFFIGLGFALLASAMAYAHWLTPDIDYKTLTLMRCSQSIAIGCLFVPTTALAYLSVPRVLNNDASALFTMFRNVAGSIGISVSTALIRERTQVRMAHLSSHMTPLSRNFIDAVNERAATISSLMGQPHAQALKTANGMMYQTLVSQAAILAYIDVFAMLAILCVLCVPLMFFFSPVKAAGGAGGH